MPLRHPSLIVVTFAVASGLFMALRMGQIHQPALAAFRARWKMPPY